MEISLGRSIQMAAEFRCRQSEPKLQSKGHCLLREFDHGAIWWRITKVPGCDCPTISIAIATSRRPAQEDAPEGEVGQATAANACIRFAASLCPSVLPKGSKSRARQRTSRRALPHAGSRVEDVCERKLIRASLRGYRICSGKRQKRHQYSVRVRAI